MAREFASIKLAIWLDDDFTDLTPPAQHLYFLLLTEPDLSYCGSATWSPKRLKQKASGWSVPEILDSALELVEARLIVVAEETDEYLVRSFVRHDGVMGHPKLCVSAARAVNKVGSKPLRKIVIGELKRLKGDRPELGAWDRPEVADVLSRDSLDGRTEDLFREAFSPGLREAVREAFSQTVSGRLERPYERAYNSNSNPTTATLQHEDKTLAQPAVERQPAPSRFDEFWETYPRKVGKAKAHTKYATAAKRTSEQTIIDGATRLANDPNLPEPKFIPHPTTWLERGGWEDEPMPPRTGGRRHQDDADFWQSEMATNRALDESQTREIEQ